MSSLVCVTNHNLKQQGDTLRRGHILLTTQNQNEVFLELVDTERTYVRDLSTLVNGLLLPLRRSLREAQQVPGQQPILSEERIRELFMNVEDLLKHHKSFLNRVEWVMLWSGPYTKASTLGNLFLQECQFFQEYRPFLEGYNNALTLCETLKATNSAFASLLTEFDSTRHRNGETAFESILITPAQRIPRYELMFRELSRHLADNCEVREALDYVSKTMRMLENASTAAPSRSAATPSQRPSKAPLTPKEKEEMAQRRLSLSAVNASSSSFMKKMRRKSTQVFLSASSPAVSAAVSSSSAVASSSPYSSSTAIATSALLGGGGQAAAAAAAKSSSSLSLGLVLATNSDSQVPSRASGTTSNTSPSSPPLSPCGSDGSSSSEFSAVGEEEGGNPPTTSPVLSSSSAGGAGLGKLARFKSFSRKLRRKDLPDDELDLTDTASPKTKNRNSGKHPSSKATGAPKES